MVLRSALITVSLFLMAWILGTGPAAQADETYPPALGNSGHRIYLSSAYHTDEAGARGECRDKVERTMARNLARRVAELHKQEVVPGGGTQTIVGESGLMYRGFTTRVGLGDPDANVASSNSWNAHAHVPLHSNASTPGGCGASVATVGTSGGAREIYQDGSSTLATRLENQLDSVTPGTGDKICVPSNCSQYSSLLEISGSVDANAKAYSETEFHTWNLGVDFMTVDRDIPALRIARAIDNHF